jgi:protein tyrosine kinase modulator
MTTNADIQQYLDVIKRRKAQFILPGVIVFILMVVVAFALPPVYKSSATILVEAQEITPDLVRTTVTGYVEERLQTISQIILGRDNLKDIIQKFDLYSDISEADRISAGIDDLRDKIKIEPITADVSAQKASKPTVATIAFTLSCEGREPYKLQQVVNHIASLYVEHNTKERERLAQGTIQFLENQLTNLRSEILAFEKQIAEYKEQHVGELPELMQLNLQTMERLEREIDSKQEGIKSLVNRKIYLEGQLALIEPTMYKVTADGKRILTPREELEALRSQYLGQSTVLSEQHPDMVSLKKKISAMESEVGTQTDIRQRQKDLYDKENQLALLAKRYSDQHPDVIALRKEVGRLRKEVQRLSASQGLLKVDDTTPENPAYINLKTSITSTKMEIDTAQRELQLLQEKYAEYQRRVENTPRVEQKYIDLQRDYTNAKKKYEESMTKLLTAKEAKGMEEGQMGEKFTILDRATLPKTPDKPNRLALVLLGVVLAAGAGLGFGSTAEYLDHSVHRADELAGVAGQPVLAAIPYFETLEDVTRNRRKRFLFAFTALGLLALGTGVVIFLRAPWR